jgi:acetyl esterase/lipase
VDPELSAVVPFLPKADLTDLAASRALEQVYLARAPRHATRRTLRVDDLVVPGYEGGTAVRLRVTSPALAPRPLAGIVHLRGSGFVMGTLDSGDAIARRLADDLDVAVISVDYRLAPEHPYPAALHDAFAALRWATGPGAAAHGVDTGTVALLGESAGGGIALGVALLSRDRGGPKPAALFLDAPTVDDRCATASMARFPDTPMWRGVDTPVIWRHYLGGIDAGSDVPVYAAPARARVDQLRGLPPTWIAAYQLDPTRDEVLDIARHLIEADVPTDLVHHSGAFHLTHNIPGLAISERIRAEKHAAIRRLLASAGPAAP